MNFRITGFEKLTFPQIERYCEEYIRKKLRRLSEAQAKDIGYCCQTIEFMQNEHKLRLVMRDEEDTTYCFYGEPKARHGTVNQNII